MIITPPILSKAQTPEFVAYEETMLREPRLLIPQGRPIGPVTSAIPKTVFAHLFTGKKSNGLNYEVSVGTSTTYSPYGLLINGSGNNVSTASCPVISPGFFTLLVSVYVDTTDNIQFITGGLDNDTNYFTSFFRYSAVSYKWGMYFAGEVLASPSAVALSSGHYTFGFSLHSFLFEFFFFFI
jgi:hypothetical protein